MAAVQSAPLHPVTKPRSFEPAEQRSSGRPIPPPSSIAMPIAAATRIRNSHIHETFSPVNVNGSFEFDRVLKCGFVEKRTRRMQAWKSIYLVLRPNFLSIYKDENEEKLRHKIHLSDLTAIAFLKDPKQKRQNLFGLFTPSRNYHIEAKSRQDALEWVDLIRKEARIEEEEEEMFLGSPPTKAEQNSFMHRRMRKETEQKLIHDERLGASSPEPTEPVPRIPTKSRQIESNQRRISQTMEYSGNEFSHSEMSDGAMGPMSYLSASKVSIPSASDKSVTNTRPPSSAILPRSTSQLSFNNIVDPSLNDPERIIFQGHLLYLTRRASIRLWTSVWVVLRSKGLNVYKNNAEHAPVDIIHMSSIIDAVEIDPMSTTKTNCLQLITEEKVYRFCAMDEEGLDRCLGAFKSLLKRRRDKEAATAVSRSS